MKSMKFIRAALALILCAALLVPALAGAEPDISGYTYEELQDLVAAHAGTSDLRKAAMERGMKVLRQDGWAKVSQGATTIEEVQRITSTFQISYDIDEDEA